MNKTITYTLTLLSGILFTYAIFQSSSSTAVIALIVVPFLMMVPWFLTKLYYRSDKTLVKFSAIFLLIIFFSWEVKTVIKAIEFSKKEKEEKILSEKKRLEAIETLKNLKNQNPSDLEIKIQNLISQAEKENNRELLMVLLEDENCPTDKLVFYGKKIQTDMGPSFAVAKNPKTPSDVLEFIFYNQTYPGFYYSTLASNPNTPEKVLRALYDLRDKNMLIIPNLSANPSTPKDILINFK